MATTMAHVNTGHGDIVHDAQFDYFGRKFATCSSDHSVKVWDSLGNETTAEPVCLAELKAHEGPVWQVAWSHPQFGSILASAGYDRRVILHREVSGGWSRLWTWEGHASSVNSIAFAPVEYGLQLASVSSDGKLAVHTHREDDSWSSTVLDVCPVGCNAVSWAPSGHIGGRGTHDADAAPGYVKRLAVACSDGLVRIYRSASGPSGGESWSLDASLTRAPVWVRDVAWSPASGLTSNILASADDDGHVCLWRQSSAGGEWVREELPPLSPPVWRLSWNTSGHMLAVTAGDAAVSLWKETHTGGFVHVTQLPDVPM